MEIKDRIRMVIEMHKLNAGAFADKIGVQRSNVSHILSGRNKPGYEFLEKLLRTFPRVSAQWLLTGKQLPDGVELAMPEIEKNVVESMSNAMDNSRVTGAKRVIKTVIFYEDFTFDTFLPNQQ